MTGGPGFIGSHDVGAMLIVHIAAESYVDRSIQGAAPFVMTNVLVTQVRCKPFWAQACAGHARVHRRG